MVHDEPTLTNVAKFHYLFGTNPVTLISRFPVEDESYIEAFGKLFENYDNPKVLDSLLIKKVIDFYSKGVKNEPQLYDRFLVEVADSIVCIDIVCT